MGFWDKVKDKVHDASILVPVAGSYLSAATKSWNAPKRPTGSLSFSPVSPRSGVPLPGDIRQMEQRTPPSAALRSMMQDLNLLGDLPPAYKAPSEAQLRLQAAALAAEQYDPQINNLRRLMQTTSKRGNENVKALGSMFNALSGSLQADIPKIQADTKKSKGQTQAEYNDLRANLAKQFADSRAAQMAEMKALGIEAAAPDVLPEQHADENFFQSQTAQQGQQALDYLTSIGRNSEEFTRQGAQLARTEGTNRQADVRQQLADLLNEYEGQIGDLGAAKQSSAAAMLAQLMGQVQENQTKFGQQAFENKLQLGKFKLDMDKFAADQSKSAMGPNYKDGLLGASQWLNQAAPGRAPELINLVMESLNLPEVREGQFAGSGGLPVKMTPEQHAALLRNLANSRGFNSTDQTALTQAILAMYGRLQ